jgi:hypothetical protein
MKTNEYKMKKRRKLASVLENRPLMFVAIFIIVSISFAVASDVIVQNGNLNADSGTFYVDEENNYVGIGTLSPLDSLHIGNVNGNISIGATETQAYNVNQEFGSIKWWNSDTSSSGPQYVASIGVIESNGFGAGGQLIFKTNTGQTGEGNPSTEAMRITGAGNVGIGASNLSTYNGVIPKLTLEGSSWTGLAIKSTGTGTDPQLYLSDKDGNFWMNILDDSDSNKLQWRYNSNPYLTIDTSGNVGIGTTTPTQRLDVVGSINVSGDIHYDGSLIPYSPMIVESVDGGQSILGMKADDGTWVGCGVFLNLETTVYEWQCKPMEEVNSKITKNEDRRSCESQNLRFDKSSGECYSDLVAVDEEGVAIR